MKNLIFTLMLLYTAVCLFAQTSNFTCEISPFIECAYERDVKFLAIEAMLNSNTADSCSIEILPAYEEDILQGLSAVFSLDTVQFPDIYFIFEKAYIRKYKYTYIKFQLDPTVAWVKKFIRSDGVDIENASLKNVLNNLDYRTEINQYTGYNNAYVTLRFNKIINLKAIVKQLKNIQDLLSVRDVYTTDFGYNNTDIQITNNNGLLEILFHFAWGDCPSGCIYSRVYSFTVDLNTCTAIYKGAVGPDPETTRYTNYYTSNFSLRLDTDKDEIADNCDDCIDYIDLINNQYLKKEVFHAADSILSNDSYHHYLNVKYKAGKSIELQSGFKVDYIYTNFEALIEGCDNVQ